MGMMDSWRGRPVEAAQREGDWLYIWITPWTLWIWHGPFLHLPIVYLFHSEWNFVVVIINLCYDLVHLIISRGVLGV
jgi:hypothetical protein